MHCCEVFLDIQNVRRREVRRAGRRAQRSWTRTRFCPEVGTRRFDARPMLESEGLVLLFSLKELEEYDCLLFCLRVELSELLLLL